MLLATCIVLGCAALILFELVLKSAEFEKARAFGAFANSLGERVAAQFYERYGDVRVFSTNDTLLTTNVEDITKNFNDYSNLYGIYDLILLVDTKGKFVAANSKDPEGKPIDTSSLKSMDFSAEPWFQAVKNGTFTEDPSKGFSGVYFEDVHIDKFVSQVYSGKRYGTSFSTPVKDAKGNLVAILSSRAGFRWVENEFKSVYADMEKQGLKSTELVLLDKAGRLLVEYSPSHNNGNTEVVHDFDELLKSNLAEEGYGPAKDAVTGTAGFRYEVSEHNKRQAVGFTPLNSKKFISTIGWNVIVRTGVEEVIADLTTARYEFYVSISILMLLSCLMGLLFATKLSRQLNVLAHSVGEDSVHVADASTQIANSSHQLSEAVHEQAAALQETVAAIEEISSMVNKNAEVARRSSDISKNSEQNARSGKETIDAMVRAITDISSANTKMTEEMEASNREIQDIVKVIAEIGNKTKVINDIVFQTKLLSFNASVEAARAGEHGKGFAVVAEEVGNLAQMSGNASREIASMLETSIEKVERIVNNSRHKIGELVTSGRSKMEAGTQIAQACGKALDNILETVTQVNHLVTEISHACQEQAQGVQEVT